MVKTYREKVPGQQAIVYAHDIEHSQATAAAFCAAEIKAVHADAKTPKPNVIRLCVTLKVAALRFYVM